MLYAFDHLAKSPISNTPLFIISQITFFDPYVSRAGARSYKNSNLSVGASFACDSKGFGGHRGSPYWALRLVPYALRLIQIRNPQSEIK
jgi:hypothetical protein